MLVSIHTDNYSISLALPFSNLFNEIIVKAFSGAR